MNTFEQILDLVNELPLDQQEILIEIIQHRIAQIRRQELALTSHSALAEFKMGGLKAQTAAEAIIELRDYLNTPEVE